MRPPSVDVVENIAGELDEAEAKAWDSLARYKFWMFGYWAAIWVHLNRASQFRRPNPFLELVKFARARSATTTLSNIKAPA